MGHVRYDVEPPENSQPVRLVYVTTSSSYDHSWHSIPHTHSNAEIFYCINGEGRFMVGDDRFTVKTDDLVVVNARQRHTEFSLEKTHLEYIVLGVSGCEFSVPGEPHVTYRAMNYAKNRRELLPCFNELVQEASARGENYSEACQHLLEVLLIRLKRHEQFDMEYKRAEGFASVECLEIKRYIDDHYSEELDLDALARRSHLSKYYLAHAFQKEFGVSPINYLLKIRLREARALLERYDHRLSDISRILGFSSQSYFCQCFKRETGLTPRDYRRAARSAEGARFPAGKP